MLNSLTTFIWKQEAQKVLLQAKILGVSNSIRNEDNSFFEMIEIKSQFTCYEQVKES